MSKFRIGVITLLAAIALGTPVFGSDTSCLSTQPLNSSMGTGSSNGCTYLDNNFVNFAGTAASGTGSSNWPALTGGFTPNINFAASGDTQLAFGTSGFSSGTVGCASNAWCVVGANDSVSQAVTYDANSTSGYLGLTL